MKTFRGTALRTAAFVLALAAVFAAAHAVGRALDPLAPAPGRTSAPGSTHSGTPHP
ncbi:hypothetical protein V1J52_19465 [Streptomyces sp. TRM 70351]|uniref:hypothetical protein n=1 Tax=Streptomyces sp. TRM 70351 TaxID=3116552 RepID=UPI002E7AC08E|nr:hypothetical protein [Streptomyces sp. TRM 70351]MEE1930334.1 hypothetical protein [Streptomyces sp. TRM 70351]